MSGQVHDLLDKLPRLLAPQPEAHQPFGSPVPQLSQQASSKHTPKSPPRLLLLRLSTPHNPHPQIPPRVCALPAVEARSGPTRVRAQFHHVRLGPWSQPAGVCLVPAPSSNTLAVVYKSDPHAVSGLGQAIDKNDQEGEAEGTALKHTSRDPLRFSSVGRGHCLRESLPKAPICSKSSGANCLDITQTHSARGIP